jgi:hypothetical protein
MIQRTVSVTQARKSATLIAPRLRFGIESWLDPVIVVAMMLAID